MVTDMSIKYRTTNRRVVSVRQQLADTAAAHNNTISAKAMFKRNQHNPDQPKLDVKKVVRSSEQVRINNVEGKRKFLGEFFSRMLEYGPGMRFHVESSEQPNDCTPSTQDNWATASGEITGFNFRMPEASRHSIMQSSEFPFTHFANFVN